jgi:hemerythrin-like domain-containing protein
MSPEQGSTANNEVLGRLNEDHSRMVKVLDALEQALDVDEHDDVNWSLVADIISYLQEYPDTVHHPLEDQLFDRVLDKGLTPAERELVHFNLAQHAEIIGATQKLEREINSILRDIVVPFDQLREHFKRYLELQRLHMRNEINHLFPLAERLLAEEDWREVAADAASHVDPMFDLRTEKFTGLYDYITNR